MKIFAIPNKERNGFHIPNEYQKGQFFEWLKKYSRFEIVPVVTDTEKARGYLHGAVEPAWCEWQYGIDPREQGLGELRHFLFMRDFNYRIIKGRDGLPVKAPQSSKGKTAEILSTYTRYCEENGAPLPNPELYKTWRDQWRMDERFPTFKDWLLFLNIGQDAMPSAETLALLDQGKPSLPEYPEYGGAPKI